MSNLESVPTTLLDVLANSLILSQLSPYLPVQSLFAVSASCRTARELVCERPEPWRHLDLTRVRSAVVDSSPIDVGGMSWRAERMDEALTEDEFYAGPLRGIFSKLNRRHILRNVQTLILDGLSVPADLIREIIAEDRYHVKILSVREAKNLNQTKLQQVLRYSVRPTRAEGTPRLKALYFFGPKDATRSFVLNKSDQSSNNDGVTTSEGAQIGAEFNQRSSEVLSSTLYDDEVRWYGCSGRAMKRPQSDWPETIHACKGLVAFDAVLCRGPRHDITKVQSTEFIPPSLATVALGPDGCECCHSCPEEPAVFGSSSDSEFPLLSPPPTHSSSLRTALQPITDESNPPLLIVRCEECLRGRWCERCNRWWCESCYSEPVSRIHPQAESREFERAQDSRQSGWTNTSHEDGSAQVDGLVQEQRPSVKVYSNFCVEHCLVSEMMSGAGSYGMWG